MLSHKVLDFYLKFTSCRLDLVGCIPTTLCRELEIARQRAPLAARIDLSCAYWRSFIQSFTRGDLVSVARAIFLDLSETSDGNTAKLNKYDMLETNLELLDQMAGDIYSHSVDADPSGRSRACQIAKKLEKSAVRVSEVISELIIFRRDSVDCLQTMARTPGVLVYQLV